MCLLNTHVRMFPCLELRAGGAHLSLISSAAQKSCVKLCVRVSLCHWVVVVGILKVD